MNFQQTLGKVFENRKEKEAIKMTSVNRGVMHLLSDTPADFIAISSLFSAIFPKVIMDDSKTEIGKAIGTNRAAA